MAGYFPEREAAVVFLDVGAMRSAGILQKLVGSTVAEAADYRQFVEATGFDYKRDLNQVMLNSAGGIHYFLLDGRFDWDKLRKYAESQGGKCDGDYCHMKGSTAERVISFRRLQNNLMALATARDEAGARAIDAKGASPVTWDVPGEPLWMRMPGEAFGELEALPPGTRIFARALESAEHVVFTLGPKEKNFQLAMNVTCKSEQEAAVLKAQLEGLTKLLNSLLNRENKKPSAADFSGLLSSGSFERQQKQVRGHWTVQQALLDTLAAGS